MVKGPFSFDPQALEFNRRGRNTHWPESAAATPAAEEAPEAEKPLLPEPAPASEPAAPPASVPPVGVAKPEGYVDPTPVRRRKRRKSHSAEADGATGKVSAWRGLLWGLILIMAVVWVWMIYTHGKNKTQRIEVDEVYILNRDDVIPTR